MVWIKKTYDQFLKFCWYGGVLWIGISQELIATSSNKVGPKGAQIPPN
jgi:hypothetical protein